MSVKNLNVLGFVSALRQFADYLEEDPAMASLDAGGDLFVAACDLLYSFPEFGEELKREQEELELILGRMHFGDWVHAFCGFCGAVASVAYNDAKKHCPGRQSAIV